MTTHTTRPVSLAALAGALAVSLLSIPASLADAAYGADEARRDRAIADPQARGLRRDAQLTRQIRDSLALDPGLATEARNIKVITNHGAVILRGSVATAEERVRIEQLVRDTAKPTIIENNITVRN